MNYFHLAFSKKIEFLSIFGKTVLRPSDSVGITEIAKSSVILISKSGRGKILPYIYVKNLFGLNFTISATQDMIDSHEFDETSFEPTSEEMVQDYGLYRVKYREGHGLMRFLHDPSRKPETTGIYLIDEILYRGEKVLESMTYAPMYNRRGDKNLPGEVCNMMHELIMGLDDEFRYIKSSLSD